MNLFQYFLDNRGPVIHKSVHYFDAYERHFSRYANRPVLMLEIGAGNGGSSQMWKRYFGPLARIVTLDINPGCVQFADSQVSVRIGDQSDTAFLGAVIDEFGTPDIVLDDGSHMMSHVMASFEFLYPKTSRTGVYMVEDLHTAYWPEYEGGLRRPGTFIEHAKHLIDELNADNTQGALPATDFSRGTVSMHIYDAIVAFERGEYVDKRSIRVGS